MAQAEAPFTPPTRPLRLDDPLLEFELATPAGEPYRVGSQRGKILVVDFWSAECPISRHFDPYLSGFAESYRSKGVVFLAIDSNVYEDEEEIVRAIRERNLAFPVLRDAGNRIADYFGALTTPHVFVFDAEGRLRYRGAINDVTFQRKEPTVNYLEEVVDALLLGRQVLVRETEPYGCTINRVWG